MGLILIISKLLGLDYGDFHLKHGVHNVVVPTKQDVEYVYVSMSEQGSDGCANSPVNSISWKVLNNSISFTVDVQTDHCKVEWFAA